MNKNCESCGQKLSKYWDDIITKYRCNNPNCVKNGSNNNKPKNKKI